MGAKIILGIVMSLIYMNEYAVMGYSIVLYLIKFIFHDKGIKGL